MSIFTNRIEREAKTVAVMIKLFCKAHHNLSVMDCSDCSELHNYALDRLNRCPFHEGKTSCKNCPIHCYRPGIRDEIKQVMRYSGPRMLLRHPILTLFHFSDNRRKEPLSVLTSTQKAQLENDIDCQGPV
jgi:hypothetical protein